MRNMTESAMNSSRTGTLEHWTGDVVCGLMITPGTGDPRTVM